MVSLLEASTLRKPHLRRKHGVWSCTTYWTPQKPCWCVGYGYSPKEAYDDWSRQHA